MAASPLPPAAAAAATASGTLGPGFDSAARWQEAERNMAALVSTAAAAAKLLDGAVFLTEPAHAAAAEREALASTVLAQQRRLNALSLELAASQAATELARAAADEAQARLREAGRTVAGLRSEVANGRVALAAHLEELLATQATVAELRAAAQHPPQFS